MQNQWHLPIHLLQDSLRPRRGECGKLTASPDLPNGIQEKSQASLAGAGRHLRVTNAPSSAESQRLINTVHPQGPSVYRVK